MVWRGLKRSMLIMLTIVVLSGMYEAPASGSLPTHSPGGKRHGVLEGPGKVRLCTATSKRGCWGRGTWQTGAHVKVVCEKGGSTATGKYRSKRWYYIGNGGRKAFIHSSWVRGEGKRVESCRGKKSAMALHWAAKRVGEVKARSAKRGLGIYSNQWSGWCAAFTRAAYSLGAGAAVAYAGNARPRYHAYRSMGRMRSWNPSKAQIGSMVFWPRLSGFGHTALYAGRGQVITTIGSGGTPRPVMIVPVSWFGTPAGYVPPKDV